MFSAVLDIAVCTLCFFTLTLSPPRPCSMQVFGAAATSHSAGLIQWDRIKPETPPSHPRCGQWE